MTGAAPSLGFGTAEQLAVLRDMEGAVEAEIELHLQRRKLWFPNDLSPADATLGEDADDTLREMRAAARDIPDVARVALALNLLTEEGLPHFHRLIAVHFGEGSPWRDWNYMWTAEEDRHGCALRDYVRDARLFDMRALEAAQYRYIEAGFDPEWEQDPYRLLAYTSLQEKATQISHANTGRFCTGIEPQAQRVLAHLARDEARHYEFYRASFAEILKRDPNRALYSLLKVTLNFVMPGHAMPGFGEMSEVVERADIFGGHHYCRIVEELLAFWEIGNLQGLSAEGRQAQDKLMAVPARLTKVADYAARKRTPRAYRFDFLGGREVRI